MAQNDGPVTRRYARALFEIAVEKNQIELFGEQLTQLGQTYSGSEELRTTLENPVFRLEQRERVLEGLLGRLVPAQDVRNFATLLLRQRRIGVLPTIASAFAQMVDDKLGRVRAAITSAKPIDIATKSAVQRALEKRTGKKVLMTTAVDPELIGGLVARVGDLVFDGSLATRLETLRNRVLN